MHGRLCLVSVIAAAFAIGAFAAEDPFIGSWKLNVSKSKYSLGPTPKAQTVVIEPGGKVSVETTNADGTVAKVAFIVTPGQEVTIPDMGDTKLTETRVDDHTVTHIWKVGSGTLNSRAVVSKNGKVMRYTSKGTNAEGKQVNNSEVYEKQ